MGRLALIALLLLCGATPPAQAGFAPQDPTGSRTNRRQPVSEIVRRIAAETRAEPSARTLVVWLVDVTSNSSLQLPLLAEAIRTSFKPGEVQHALYLLAQTPRLAVKPTGDPAAIADAIRAQLAAIPDNWIKNCLANVREAAKYAAGVPGIDRRHLVLYTLDNADNEDDVEVTRALMQKQRVMLHAITVEAIYSDPFWRSALNGTLYMGIPLNWSTGRLPDNVDAGWGAWAGENPYESAAYRKLTCSMRGPDSPYVEFPFGWPFALVSRSFAIAIDPAYAVASGHAPYGISRIASEAYLAPSGGDPRGSFCARWHCTACANTHRECGAVFDELKLRVTAPFAGSRAEYLQHYARQPLFRATLAAWERLFAKGIIRGAPPVEFQGGKLVESRLRNHVNISPLWGTEWDGIRQTALRWMREVQGTHDTLASARAGDPAGTEMRLVATADALLVHLRMLVCGLEQLSVFCEEMARVTSAKKAFPPPEPAGRRLEEYVGERIVGQAHWSLTLCHGGEALKSFAFQGDAAVRKRLHDALDFADRIIEAHRGTPWEMLARRASVPVFVPIIYSTYRERMARPTSDVNKTRTQTQAPKRPNRPDERDQGDGGDVATGGD